MFLLPTGFLACGFSSENWELEKAQNLEEEKDFDGAIGFYYRYLRKNLENQKSVEAAQKIYQIAKLHSTDKSLVPKVLNHIILRSDKEFERIEARENLANYYFQSLGDHELAIAQLNRYLVLEKSEEKKNLARLKIAKSYFYLNNFYQANVELEEIISTTKDDALKFDSLNLRANVFQSEEKPAKAIETYEKIISEFPIRAEKEQVFLALSLALEDNKEYKKALETLKLYRDKAKNPEFIDQKIESLNFTISQQPGARGRVK